LGWRWLLQVLRLPFCLLQLTNEIQVQLKILKNQGEEFVIAFETL
jgi:hypothetical protein